MLAESEPSFDDVEYPELRIAEAVEARTEIASLRMLFPMTDWSSILDDNEPQVDLYASRRKKLWITGGALVTGVAVLAVVAPGVAAGLGFVTVFLAIKVYITGSRRGYWG